MWLLLPLLATVLYGTAIGGHSSGHDIVVINSTGIYIARLEVDGVRKAEEIQPHDKILVSISPHKHHLRVVMRGGADVDWPKFDFSHVSQVIFERHQNRFDAIVQ